MIKAILLPLATSGAALALSPLSMGQAIVNGSFDDSASFGGNQNGNQGDPAYFVTSYTWTPPVANANTGAGQYTVAKAARPWNPFGTNVYGDHTTGAGNYLVLNGSTSPNRLVWQQAISGFTVGASYRFGGFISCWSGGVPGTLDFRVNGIKQGETISSTIIPNTWFSFERSFVASSTTLTLGLVSTSTASGGNDFALDDLSIAPVPEPTSSTIVGLALLCFLRRRKRS